MRRPSSVITCKTHRPTPRFSASLNALADVSKEKLDIYNPVTKATTGEPNTPEGLRKAARKAKAVVCCEPREGRPEIETGFHKYAWHTCGLQIPVVDEALGVLRHAAARSLHSPRIMARLCGHPNG